MSYGDLGDLQLAVLHVLWASGASTVREVMDALSPDRSSAYTTVLTVLRTLEKRGLVDHVSADGSRMYRYRASVSIEDIRSERLADLVNQLFEGSPTVLVDHMIARGMLQHCDLLDLVQNGS